MIKVAYTEWYFGGGRDPVEPHIAELDPDHLEQFIAGTNSDFSVIDDTLVFVEENDEYDDGKYGIEVSTEPSCWGDCCIEIIALDDERRSATNGAEWLFMLTVVDETDMPQLKELSKKYPSGSIRPEAK